MQLDLALAAHQLSSDPVGCLSSCTSRRPYASIVFCLCDMVLAIWSPPAIAHLVLENLVPLTLDLDSAVVDSCLLRVCDRSGTGLRVDTSTLHRIVTSRAFTLLNEAPRTAVSPRAISILKYHSSAADEEQGYERQTRCPHLV